ncbi:Cys-tRNA(Pro) deacylase [Bermanella sp. R86510]|uniref:Cys-tRNA(Pro) deacylase n=1 Tax=unclassified Bermanella TaxID=2627862 RepID=UPI0037C8FAAD
MTPGVNAIEKSQYAFKLHEYSHDASAQSYGLEAADKLGVDSHRVFKTLLVDTGNKQLVVGIIPVNTTLNLKRMAKALAVKKVEMADKADVERITGYVVGGVSPLGQKRSLTTIIDASAQGLTSIFVSAGRRGLEIELAPNDLIALVAGKFSDISQ